RKVQPLSTALGAAPTAKATCAAVTTVGGVALRRRGIPAERSRAIEDQLVLGRHVGRRAETQFLAQTAKVGVGIGTIETVEAVAFGPVGSYVRRRFDTGRPIDHRAAAYCRAGQDAE